MGIRSSHYIEEPYRFDTPGVVDSQQFTTGDVILFSTNWERSRFKRTKIRATKGLWTYGGVIVNATNCFAEAMVQEFRPTYSDDYLMNYNTLSQVSNGPRMVSLACLLRENNYKAYMIRRTIGNTHMKVLANQEADFIIANQTYLDEDRDFPKTPQGFLSFSLRRMGILPIGYANLDMNDFAGSKLARCTGNSYAKGDVYVVG